MAFEMQCKTSFDKHDSELGVKLTKGDCRIIKQVVPKVHWNTAAKVLEERNLANTVLIKRKFAVGLMNLMAVTSKPLLSPIHIDKRKNGVRISQWAMKLCHLPWRIIIQSFSHFGSVEAFKPDCFNRTLNHGAERAHIGFTFSWEFP